MEILVVTGPYGGSTGLFNSGFINCDTCSINTEKVYVRTWSPNARVTLCIQIQVHDRRGTVQRLTLAAGHRVTVPFFFLLGAILTPAHHFFFVFLTFS